MLETTINNFRQGGVYYIQANTVKVSKARNEKVKTDNIVGQYEIEKSGKASVPQIGLCLHMYLFKRYLRFFMPQ
jgi:hypothetical protein